MNSIRLTTIFAVFVCNFFLTYLVFPDLALALMPIHPDAIAKGTIRTIGALLAATFINDLLIFSFFLMITKKSWNNLRLFFLIRLIILMILGITYSISISLFPSSYRPAISAALIGMVICLQIWLFSRILKDKITLKQNTLLGLIINIFPGYFIFIVTMIGTMDRIIRGIQLYLNLP